MARKKEITVVGMLILEDGSIIPMDQASPEQLQLWRERTIARLSANMSEYYAAHLDEFARL